VLGTAKVMSYEDLEKAKAARAAKETAKPNSCEVRLVSNYCRSHPTPSSALNWHVFRPLQMFEAEVVSLCY
jgi:hypothetical protein